MTNEIAKTSPFEITTFAEAERYAKMIAESDFAPKDYKGKPGNVMIAMQMGFELGLKPSQAIQNIAVVNGRPMVWGDAALALVRGNPECEYIREWTDGTIKGGDANAICESKRGDEIVRREFSIKQAMQAGLIGKQGPWTQYPERMLQMRARGYCLRDAFPDVLKGVYVEGELDGIEPEAVEQKEQSLGTHAVKQAISSAVTAMKDHAESEAKILDINPETGEVIEDNSPTFDDIKKQMEDANTVEQLILASDLARTLKDKTKEQHAELSKIYKQKQLAVKG
jgi:hypothetical protein